MNKVNFFLEGLGFKDWFDFKTSSFGFMNSELVIKIAISFGALASIIQTLFGIDWLFLIGYFIFICFEWISGVLASYRKGEKHESRKLGRMLFKIAVYTLLIMCLNLFHSRSHWPVILGYEIDPFLWLYWVVLLIIIWQLLVSILENLQVLGYKWAGIALKIINKKFYKQFDLDA